MSRKGPVVLRFPKKGTSNNYTADELKRYQINEAYRIAYPVIGVSLVQTLELMKKDGRQHIVDGLLRACLGHAVSIVKQNGATLQDLQNLLRDEIWESIQLHSADENPAAESAPTPEEKN